MKLPALPVLGILPPRWRRRRATPGATAGTISPPGEAERLLRRLDFTVIRQLDGLRQGEHRNAALGFGLDLAELRPYQPGDDVRALDWNVTARMGEAYVRRYHEDRDVTAWLLLDLTASTDFGSARQTKRDLLLDVAGTLARLLTSRGDRVGALLYTGSARRRRTRQYAAAERRHSWRMGLQRVDERTERLPAELVASGAGRVHVLQLLRRALDASRRGAPRVPAFMGPSRGHETDLASLLEQGFRTAHQRSLIFLLSDFLDGGPPDGGSSGFRVRSSELEPVTRNRELGTRNSGLVSWEAALGPLARRHEVVGVWLRDPREVELPDVGVVTFEDAESGAQLVVDTSQPSLRAQFAALAVERAAALERRFTRHGAALWTLSTAEPLVPALVRFLEQRRRTAVGARRLSRT